MKKRVKKQKSKFELATTMVATVKYFETFHVIRDGRGEVIFTGSQQTANRIMKLLKRGAK